MRDDTGTTRRRRLLPVGDIPFVGGCLCVDFVNTTGAREREHERERIESYGDVLTWSRRAGLLSSVGARRLRATANRHPRKAARAVAGLRRIRENLYRVLRCVAENSRAKAEDITFLDRLFRVERQNYELVRAGTRYELRRQQRLDELDCIVWPIVASASKLLTSAEQRLKRCGECDWLFVDDSKNGSRLWCKKACGDRVRARRHYARTKS